MARRTDDETIERMRAAFNRCAPWAFLVALPLALYVPAAVEAHRTGNIGADFRSELYPEAKMILHGTNPFPSVHANVLAEANRVFPVPGALFFAPLTALPSSVAADVAALLLIAMLALAAWVMGVRDWRIYGLLGLWPSTIAAVQTGNLTIPLTLLLAVAWKYRERRYAPGLAIGAAIAMKLFLWPLLVWLLAVRRVRAAVVGTVAGLGGGVLTVLPFIGLGHYWRLLDNMQRGFGPESYTLTGLLTQSHAASLHTAGIATDVVGIAVLGMAFMRGSLTLTLASALVLSPIVWNHYFILLLVPLGLASPTLSPAWFVPLFLWFCPGLWVDVRLQHVVIALITFATVIVLVEWQPSSLRKLLPARTGEAVTP